MTKMSKILWEGHALSTDPSFPRAYVASILNPSITNFWLRHWIVSIFANVLLGKLWSHCSQGVFQVGQTHKFWK